METVSRTSTHSIKQIYIDNTVAAARKFKTNTAARFDESQSQTRNNSAAFNLVKSPKMKKAKITSPRIGTSVEVKS